MTRALSVVALGVALCVASAAAKDRKPEADKLVREGRDRYSEGTFEQRRTAIRQLEQAALLAPHDTKVLGELGRAYLDAGFNHAAMQTFDRITESTPSDADAWFGLGQVWKRDWLATLAPASLDKSIVAFGNSARLRPENAEAWTTLGVLRAEQGDAHGAEVCARQALVADSAQAGAPLVNAYLVYRTGRLAEAESLFAVAFPRMAPQLAARFRDVTPLVPADEGERLADMNPVARAEFSRRFWSESDPDPTTRTNEARIEYWARVAHAILLFSDSWNPHWDMRAELYVRYGSPAHVAYQPPGQSLAARPNEYDHWYQDFLSGVARNARRVGDADPMWYPMHVQVWEYPKLGLNVVLQDRAISQHYELPRDSYGETDPVPDSATMARNGLVATAGGRAAFASLPPGVRPLVPLALVSAFEGERGARLLAHVALTGSPQQAFVAECVVIDSSEQEVARTSRALGASRCDPGAARAGDFAFDLPPGRYRVGVAVSDGQGGRGVLRLRHALAPVGATLSMSDLVLVCGPADASLAEGSVRLDPNLSSHIAAHEPLRAYFEVYHLRSDPGGATRFDYEYAVHPVNAAARPWFRHLFGSGGASDQVTARTAEEGIGPTRRQYISVPTEALPPGRYRVALTVHDHLAGRSCKRETIFEKDAPGATAPVAP